MSMKIQNDENLISRISGVLSSILSSKSPSGGSSATEQSAGAASFGALLSGMTGQQRVSFGDWIREDGTWYRSVTPPYQTRGVSYYADAEGNLYAKSVVPGATMRSVETPDWFSGMMPGNPPVSSTSTYSSGTIVASWKVPASPFASEVTQPDGTKISLVQKGDESRHWTENPEGYSLVQNSETGYWEYALKKMQSVELSPSGTVVDADAAPPEGLQKHIKPVSFETGRDSSKSVQASPFPVQVLQPDGKAITLIQNGDENLHWWETEDGYSVVKNSETGYWEYAENKLVSSLVPSGIAYRPEESAPEGWPLHLS